MDGWLLFSVYVIMLCLEVGVFDRFLYFGLSLDRRVTNKG
jgi:hypothetical protein